MKETLEERVVDRTQTLEAQNKQLVDYAYINSHKLRGPFQEYQG